MSDCAKVLVAPALLVTIALAQLFYVWSSDLTPWKGGGFGMFATGDSLAGRYLRVYLESTSSEQRRKQTPVDMPSLEERTVKTLYDKAVASPSQQRLTDLAAAIAGLEWSLYPSAAAADDTIEPRWRVRTDPTPWSTPDTDGDDARSPARSALSERVYSSEDRRIRNAKASSKVSFDAVRVELWRFMLEPGSSTVSGGPVAVTRLPLSAAVTSTFRRF